MLDNACEITACVHSVLNNSEKVPITPDSILDKFFKESYGKSPEDACSIMEKSTDFQNMYKGSFFDKAQSAVAETQDEVQTHFIAFVINENK